jgi:hypothetical protein
VAKNSRNPLFTKLYLSNYTGEGELRKLLSLIILSFLVTAVAQANTCQKVYSKKEAYNCIEEFAYELHGEGELPHSIGVTSYRKGKWSFRKITGLDQKFDYVAVIQVHYDEDLLLYIAIDKGRDVRPILGRTINMVDEDERELLSNRELRLYIPQHRIENMHDLD